MTVDSCNDDVIRIGVLHIKNNGACAIVIRMGGVQSDLCIQQGADQYCKNTKYCFHICFHFFSV
jgi:hypothetical protein